METKMQQLSGELKNIPMDTSLVCSSISSGLNREETLGVQNKVLTDNILEENLQSGKTGQNLRVPVLNMRGNPLMPTTPRKARKLIEQDKAQVVSCKPFTIQLKIATGETKQDLTLGIDAGSRVIGFSVVDSKREHLSGELELRQDISKKLEERRMYRRNRRNKLWYRKPRFLNRVKSKHKGWLAPSVQYKVDMHVRLVEKIKSLLPITKTVVEVAKFDTQKLQNVDIKGVEYQQGQMQDYDNLRAFIFERDNYTCQICKKQGGVLQTHHIVFKSQGGSDKPDNLATVHKECHKKYHKGKVQHKFKIPLSFKDTCVMNNVRKYVVDKLNCDYTYGYVTKRKRKDLGLDKTHYNDAFVIAGGEDHLRTNVYQSKPLRRNNRCLQKNRNGFRPSIRRQRHKLQPNDLVRFRNKKFKVKSAFNYGTYVKLDDGTNTNVKNVEVINYGKGLCFA